MMLCQLCAQPTGDTATVCTTCVGALTAALRTITHGELGDDLDTATARLAVFSVAGPRARSAETPLPINLAAAEARQILTDTLAAWATTIHQADPRRVHGPTCAKCQHTTCRRIRRNGRPARELAPMARWLTNATELIRHAEWGPQAVDEIRAAIRHAHTAIDRPTERTYAGPCPECGTPIYGDPDRDINPCRTHGCTGVATDRQTRIETAIRAAHNRLVTAKEGALAARAYGHPITERWINKLAETGHLIAIDPTSRPRHYILGHIIDHARATTTRRRAS